MALKETLHKISHNGGNIDAAFYSCGVANAPVVIYFSGNGEWKEKMTFANFLKNSHHQNILKKADIKKFDVLIPQFDRSLNDNWIGEWSGGKYIDRIVEFANTLNPNKPHLTGQSGGGGGIWDYIARSAAYVDKISSCLILCGTATNMTAGMSWGYARDAKLPVMAICGSNDSETQYRRPNKVQADAVGGIYTELKGLGHVIASNVYGDDGYIDWMLSKGTIVDPVEPPKKPWITSVSITNIDGKLTVTLAYSDNTTKTYD